MASRRPTEYSTALAVEICTRLVEGKSLSAICKLATMPRLATVYAWRAAQPEFDRLLASARGDQADTLFCQAIDIADEKCVDMVAVQRNRLRVDARKWAAGKLKPKVYGDQLAIGGSEDLPPIQIDPLEGAKRVAFVLARAGHLIANQQSTPSTASTT